MDLAEYYSRQFAWREWRTIFDALPLQPGQCVLDLGCGIGDQAAELVKRGAHVVGLDMIDDLLAAARERGLANAEFRQADLRALPDFGCTFDGLWGGFSAAYFVDLAAVLRQWAQHLRPNGWIALVEIDDFFGHEPLSARAKGLFEAYSREALAAGRYDFHMGRKLRGHLQAAGFGVTRAFTVPDQELSFDGPASAEVINAWRERLEGMGLLQDACGAEFPKIRDEFLACLGRPDHRSLAKVHCCIAEKNES